ncbi:hypothetical protein EHO98_22635 [Leptospira stimsonii]|uniref:DNA-binding protein n=2 Tax=Leptospira stimsonii TaxID=2202203 RepID=A0ABY2MXF4_9LEPT|nr:hypothetical protein EHO98_22635 [Leptospira stimsonii]TGM11010.1 hypothetical protein EHQ90_17220 [Leptospira stimsonii]
MEAPSKRNPGKFCPGVIDDMPYARSKQALLAKIAELDINGRQKYGGCVTLNKDLGKYVKLAETTVSKYIREFKRDGLLIQTEFHGHYRILRISNELYDQLLDEKAWRTELAKNKKAQYNNPSQPTTPSIKGNPSPGTKYGADPYIQSPPCLTSLETSVPTFVPLTFDENGEEWKKFLNYSDEKLTKSSRKTLHELKVKFDGNTLTLSNEVSDSLSKLISKYFTEERNLKLEVKIEARDTLVAENKESKSELKEKVKETFEAEVQKENLPNSEFSLVPEKPAPEKNIEYEYFYNIRFRDQVIRGFLDYSNLKLERADLEILRNVRIYYDLEKITFFDPIPGKLKNHIRDYFLNKTKMVIVPVFVENIVHFHTAA